jgi:hypothetical protein
MEALMDLTTYVSALRGALCLGNKLSVMIVTSGSFPSKLTGHKRVEFREQPPAANYLVLANVAIVIFVEPFDQDSWEKFRTGLLTAAPRLPTLVLRQPLKVLEEEILATLDRYPFQSKPPVPVPEEAAILRPITPATRGEAPQPLKRRVTQAEAARMRRLAMPVNPFGQGRIRGIIIEKAERGATNKAADIDRLYADIKDEPGAPSLARFQSTYYGLSAAGKLSRPASQPAPITPST